MVHGAISVRQMTRVICHFGAVGLAWTWGIVACWIVIDGAWSGNGWEIAAGLILTTVLARLLWW